MPGSVDGVKIRLLSDKISTLIHWVLLTSTLWEILSFRGCRLAFITLETPFPHEN